MGAYKRGGLIKGGGGGGLHKGNVVSFNKLYTEINVMVYFQPGE